MNLPLIYSRVTKERPELVVVNHTRGEPLTATKATVSTWVWRGTLDTWVPTQQAEALIESHWLRKLPRSSSVTNSMDRDGTPLEWFVVGPQHDGPGRPTPLEALAEYFVPGSTKEEA